MKRLALVFVIACGSRTNAPPPTSEPIPSVASATAPSATPVFVDAGARFKVVKETVHATTQMIVRVGDIDARWLRIPPIEPSAGVLSGSAAAAACYVATGVSPKMDAECKATIDSANGGTLATSVEVEFEDDTMQSRSRTHVSMRGTITVNGAHVIVRASFTGQERFQFRSPCEKNDGCEHCDPLVKKPGCKPTCFCPFTNVGGADIETSYSP